MRFKVENSMSRIYSHRAYHSIRKCLKGLSLIIEVEKCEEVRDFSVCDIIMCHDIHEKSVLLLRTIAQTGSLLYMFA